MLLHLLLLLLLLFILVSNSSLFGRLGTGLGARLGVLGTSAVLLLLLLLTLLGLLGVGFSGRFGRRLERDLLFLLGLSLTSGTSGDINLGLEGLHITREFLELSHYHLLRSSELGGVGRLALLLSVGRLSKEFLGLALRLGNKLFLVFGTLINLLALGLLGLSIL